MADNQEVVLVATYRDLDVAREDFHELNNRVKNKGTETRSAALVTKDADGRLEVAQAANRHGRTGAGWGAGAGFVVGILQPPIVAAVLVGAAAGALVASFAEHRLRVGLRREIGPALENGTAVALALMREHDAYQAEYALNHAPQVSRLPMNDTTVNRLEELVADEVRRLGRTG